MTATIRTERVTFSAAGVELVGELRLPDRPEGSPAIALTGPFTGVKDQVTGLYAERLAREGLVTLAFDHRGLGESGGRRGHEDSEGKLADLRSAVSLLTRRPEVDPGRVGLVGVCLGGGYAVRAAAADPRVKAVAGIAGAYNSPAWFAEQMGLDAYRAALGSFLDHYDEYLPAVAPGGGEAAMPGDEPYAYYGTSRSASPHWSNRVTRGSLHSLMTFDALGAAPLLADTPLLVVHGEVDAYCPPELADELLGRSSGKKEMLWLDCHEHIDLYDVEPYVTRAAQATADFLHRHL
ncbi:alpha/beta hydrolase [Microbispora sp. NPDC049125]|uniref:alpha/beta hydrolase n=1 Tax=Microbispora sp. NPDC049125 TaxID=3154929 RepID=UPI0034672F5F